MPDLLHHIASFARFSAKRGERERHDADAMRELARRPLELARGLELEWLGVAGYRLSYAGATIYIDPYLSRVPLSSVIRRTPALANAALHERYIRPPGQLAGVLVGHTHFDHAIDVPEIARRHGCRAYGSSSLVNLMRLHGLGERARILPRLQPRTIVASHFDDFFRPIDAAMGFSTNVNLAAVPDEVAAVSRDFEVATLPPMEPVGTASVRG